MSRTLSTNSGSLESLKVSERCGCTLKARPYPPDRRVRQPALPGHRTERPVDRVGRRGFQRPLDDRGHILVRERSRPARTRLIRKSVDALLQEAAAPLADRVLVHAEFECHRLIGQAVCAAQDHAAAIGQRARDPAASSLTFKIRPFFIAQNQDRHRPPNATCHRKDLQIQSRWLLYNAIYFNSR